MGLGIIIFVFNFDRLMNKKSDFGWQAVLAYSAGIIAIVNSARIYMRR
jgi:hypothetical protein